MYQTGRTSHSRDASNINSLPISAIAFPETISKEFSLKRKTDTLL